MNRYLKAAAIRLPILRRFYEDKEALRRTLAEVERQRDGFLRERDEAEAKLKELYCYHHRLESEIERVYAGHDSLESEINFLKYRMEMLDRLHEEVVQRKWQGEQEWSSYMCMFPFERIEVLPRGEVYTCCSAAIKNGFTIGNLFTEDMDQIWNSKNARKLRFSVSKGNFEYCQETCIFWKNREQKLYPIVKRKDTPFQTYEQCIVEKGPSHITLSCDESCNLQCKSCRTKKKVLSAEESKRLEQVLFQKIRPLLKDCEQLDMLGSGEVFASAACTSLLKTLTHAEFPRLRIGLITNGQLFTPERWAGFDNLKDIPLHITVSVDGAQKETYESLRLGGKWEVLYENMEFLGSLRKSEEIREFTLQFVVQRGNFRELHEFVTLAKDWGADQVNFLRLDNWGTYSPETYRQMNVFDPSNPLRNEAEALLKEIFQTTYRTEVMHNIPGIK